MIIILFKWKLCIFYCRSFPAVAVRRPQPCVKWKCYWQLWLIICTALVIQLEEFVVPHASTTVRLGTVRQGEKSCMKSRKLFILNYSVYMCVFLFVCVCTPVRTCACVRWIFILFGMIHHCPMHGLSSMYQTKTLQNESRRIMGLGRLLSPNNFLPIYIANVWLSSGLYPIICFPFSNATYNTTMWDMW